MKIIISMNLKRWIILVLFAIPLFLPLFASMYWLHIVMMCCYFISLASGWNLLGGFTGQFSFAHLAFASISAYTSALLAIHAGIPIFLGIIIGCLFAGGVGLLLGALCLRLRAGYLFLVTFAFAEVVRRVITVESQITKGTAGLKVPFLFGEYGYLNSILTYYVFWGMMVGTLGIIYAVLYSRIGLFLKSIREDEEAAAVLGVNVVKWKLFTFVLTSILAGLAGSIFGHYVGVISPETLGLLQMGNITAMTVIGGMGTLAGPVLGAFVVQVTTEFIRFVGNFRYLLWGALMVIVIKYARGGLWEALLRLTKHVLKLLRE